MESRVEGVAAAAKVTKAGYDVSIDPLEEYSRPTPSSKDSYRQRVTDRRTDGRDA